MIRNSVTHHAWLTCTSLPSPPSPPSPRPSSPSPSSPSLSPALPSRRLHGRLTRSRSVPVLPATTPITTHAYASGYRLPTRLRLHLVRSTSLLLHLHTVPAACDCRSSRHLVLPIPWMRNVHSATAIIAAIALATAAILSTCRQVCYYEVSLFDAGSGLLLCAALCLHLYLCALRERGVDRVLRLYHDMIVSAVVNIISLVVPSQALPSMLSAYDRCLLAGEGTLHLQPGIGARRFFSPIIRDRHDALSHDLLLSPTGIEYPFLRSIDLKLLVSHVDLSLHFNYRDVY